MEKAANANFIVFGLNPKFIALVASTLTIPIYDFSLQNSLAHCKYNCNEKSINITDPIRYLLDRGNMARVKVADSDWKKLE